MRPRQVHQLLAGLSYGDAVSSHALSIQSALRAAGYVSEIFVEHVHPRMVRFTRPYWEYPKVSAPETVCLFHFSIGSATAPLIHSLPDRLVTIYHNITPPEYFLGFRGDLVGLTYWGRRQLGMFSQRAALALADSEFNRQELESAGYGRTAVLPLVPEWTLYERAGSRLVRALYDDGRTNFLFVGRISPNKRVEDLIRVVAYYQRFVDPHCRLILVGNHWGYERYYDRLQEMVKALGVEEVVFTGHVDEDELVAYYRCGDLFLCLSEHEGYCVPLIEAMAVGLPVVAYDAGAVRGTLRGAGVLIEDKSVAPVAELCAEIVGNAAFRSAVLRGQERVLGELRAIDYAALVRERLAPVLD
jgi:glycosyltransferase involved in cell wall biosynthesis